MTLIADIDIGSSLKFQGGASAASSFTDLGSLISLWLPNLYTAIGIILFLFVLGGGVALITSSGDQKKLEEIKKILTFAILGFAILFGSYWIIQIVQIVTGVPILNPGI